MSSDVSAPSRVRCRQITEGDFDALCALFLEGFPFTDREFWDRGLARITTLPQIDDLPRYGYVLETDDGLVGVLLTIFSRRAERIISNVSGWYVRPSYRAYSIMLAATATRFKHVTYVNVSPIKHTWRTLELTGWKRYNSGRSAVFSAWKTDRGKIRKPIPEILPAHERKLLQDHRAWNGVSLVCEKDGTFAPFVFRPCRITPMKLPVMELIYCRNMEDFELCSGSLGRYFLVRGRIGFVLDGKVKDKISRYRPDIEPRFYKGAQPPDLNDFAYTERLIFG